MSAHSPMPWSVSDRYSDELRDANGKFITGVTGASCAPGSDAIERANAAHIVACVNAHDALVRRVAEMDGLLREATGAVCLAGEYASDGEEKDEWRHLENRINKVLDSE